MTTRSYRPLMLAIAIAMGLCVVSPKGASANCALTAGYEPKIDDTDVEICPLTATSRGCSAGDVMLRENINTGEVVVLDGTCSDECYVDECVPGGQYRYGFEEPYECNPSACSTDYNVLVTVQGKGRHFCLRDRSTETPANYEGTPPWPTTGPDISPPICEYGAGSPLSSRQWFIVLANLAVLVFGGALWWWHRRRRRRYTDAAADSSS